jgi:hypothetical protein
MSSTARCGSADGGASSVFFVSVAASSNSVCRILASPSARTEGPQLDRAIDDLGRVATSRPATADVGPM